MCALPIKVWLGSWNCSGRRITQKQVDAWLGDARQWADLIVIGQQEAKNPAHDLIGGGFQKITWDDVGGFVGGGYAHQYLGVLARDGFAQVSLLRERGVAMRWALAEAGMGEAPAERPRFWALGGKALRTDKPLQNKGGVALVVELFGGVIAFISAHLESKDSAGNKRRAEVQQLLRAADRITAQRGPRGIRSPHLTFFMGDLNFRLSPRRIRFAGGKAVHVPAAGGRRGVVLGPSLELSHEALAQLLVSNRDTLVSADTLTGGTERPTDLGAKVFDADRWRFPRVEGTPTYKLKPDRGAADLDPVLNAAPDAADRVLEIFFAGKPRAAEVETKEKRGGEMDFGWLDRIGFRTLNELPFVQVVVGEAASRPQVTGSDHAPVSMRATIHMRDRAMQDIHDVLAKGLKKLRRQVAPESD